ncbi:MAG TPA: thiol peroxidase [Pseudogracilibacillus sp.]|nr:thiol peroxidase [Pseudogracilibacillus sp.]
MRKVTFKGNAVTLLGDQVKVGDKAHDFTVLSNSLEERSLADYECKVKLISVVPSLDTELCSLQTKKFNEAADDFPNIKILTISMDLPFAQSRWCGAEGIKQLETLSDHRDASFGKSYGVLIEELRLLARSIFVVNEKDEVTYVEYVDEVASHPDYDKVLEHLRENY